MLSYRRSFNFCFIKTVETRNIMWNLHSDYCRSFATMTFFGKLSANTLVWRRHHFLVNILLVVILYFHFFPLYSFHIRKCMLLMNIWQQIKLVKFLQELAESTFYCYYVFFPLFFFSRLFWNFSLSFWNFSWSYKKYAFTKIKIQLRVYQAEPNILLLTFFVKLCFN